MKTTLVQLNALLILFVATPALATYSIVAVDSQTGQVGAVIASCVGEQSLSIATGLAPGKGAVVAQAKLVNLSWYEPPSFWWTRFWNHEPQTGENFMAKNTHRKHTDQFKRHN